MTQENKSRATLAAMAATGATALAAESYIYLIAKIKQKNGGTFKLLDAVDIDWTGFDWGQSGVPTYTLPAATDKALGGVKIGANISNNAGTISVSGDNVKAALGFTPANQTDLATVQGYFDNGVAKNANQLGGHGADYFATATSVNNVLSGLDWKNNVADAEALKAIKTPTEGMTVSLADTNQIYRFDAQNTAKADAAPDVYVAADKTAGAWIKIGSGLYSPATNNADGLMSAGDKAKLDALPTNDTLNNSLNGKVDKVNGKGLSTNDFSNDYKNKVDGLANTIGTFFANVNIGSDTDVNQSDIVIPDGVAIKVGDNVIDNQGGQYVVTAVIAASGSGDTATPAKVHCGPVGLQLALKSSVDAVTTKVNGMANIKTIGTGLELAADGTLTATAQTPDLSAYQTTAQADAKYATKADVDVVSADFITGLFA